MNLSRAGWGVMPAHVTDQSHSVINSKLSLRSRCPLEGTSFFLPCVFFSHTQLSDLHPERHGSCLPFQPQYRPYDGLWLAFETGNVLFLDLDGTQHRCISLCDTSLSCVNLGFVSFFVYVSLQYR